jgi:hypothetical protein
MATIFLIALSVTAAWVDLNLKIGNIPLSINAGKVGSRLEK